MEWNWLAPLRPVRPTTVDRDGLVERLRITALSAGYALTFVPALVLVIGTVLSIALSPLTVGLALAWLVVPATAAVAAAHRHVSGALSGRRIGGDYADTAGTNVVTRTFRWITDETRWRDFALLCFSATGGFGLSLVPVTLLVAPAVHLIAALIDGGIFWWLISFLGGPALVVWWLVTPTLVGARVEAERNILGRSRVAELQDRVADVTASRAETLDHNAAELRRIERDIHDGAQARMAAVGMSVGLAEKLLGTDPAAASELLREARESTVAALEDLRSVLRGVLPPVLADRGLSGGLEALVAEVPLPVTVTLDLPDDLPAPLQSALYFTAAECLANTLKHAGADRLTLSGSVVGGLVVLAVGDDGRGGADPTGAGLDGIRRRLTAFDGTLTVASPPGGPTVVTVELPCPPKS